MGQQPIRPVGVEMGRPKILVSADHSLFTVSKPSAPIVGNVTHNTEIDFTAPINSVFIYLFESARKRGQSLGSVVASRQYSPLTRRGRNGWFAWVPQGQKRQRAQQTERLPDWSLGGNHPENVGMSDPFVRFRQRGPTFGAGWRGSISQQCNTAFP